MSELRPAERPLSLFGLSSRRARWLAGLALLAAAFAILVRPQLWQLVLTDRARYGRDLQVVCTALEALRGGLDPYLHSRPFPVPNTVLHVYLFAPLCAFGPDPIAYGPVYIALAAAACAMIWRFVPRTPLDRALVVLAVFTGLRSFNWQLATGNVAIVELPLAAATLCLIAARRHAAAGAVFGLLATVKLLPLIGVVAFLCLPETLRVRAKALGSALGSFILVHLLNAVLFSRWLPSYMAQLSGRMPGHDLSEPGGWLNQNTIDFVADLTRALGVGPPVTGLALACLGLGTGWLAALACGRLASRHDRSAPAATVSVMMLILLLFLFRQKNYAFETLIPFIIVAAWGVGRWCAIGAIMASILVPAIIRNTPMPLAIADYNQLLGAWAATAIILFGAIRMPQGLAGEPSPGPAWSSGPEPVGKP